MRRRGTVCTDSLISNDARRNLIRGKSFFSKIKRAIAAGEDERPENIDREVEEAVNAIKSQHQETLDGAGILHDNWGCAGDLVFMMDLVPIYDAIGGPDSTVGRRLGEVCINLFEHHVAAGEALGRVEGELFFMRFAEPDHAAGFRLAAEIVKDVGTQMMGQRFQQIALPQLVVVADVADIQNASGHLDLAAAKAVKRRGGIRLDMGEPKQGDPAWLLECWRRVSAPAAPEAPEWHDVHRRKPGDTDWVTNRRERRKVVLLDASRAEQPSGKPCRAEDHETEVDW